MSSSGRLPFRLRYRTIVLLLALVVILWSGFSYWSEYSENAARLARERLAPPVGVPCQIVLGIDDSITGTIVDQSERWIVLAPQSSNDKSGSRIWIPRERVLLIRVER